jgi:hypothetical protein
VTDSERLSRLEERVARLEAGPVPVPSADVFWALEGLKAHTPEAVLFTGSVTLPTGELYEWQMTRPAQELLDGSASTLVERGSHSSPAMKPSTRRRPSSSGSCTGGDFIS